MKDEKLTKLFKKMLLPQILKEYNPKPIIIFGSRTKGNATLNSDLDIIIVSIFFQEIPFIERMPSLLI